MATRTTEDEPVRDAPRPAQAVDWSARLEGCRVRLQSVELLFASSPRDALALARSLLDDVIALLAALHLPEDRQTRADARIVMRAIQDRPIHEHLEAALSWLQRAEGRGDVSAAGIGIMRRVIADLARDVGSTEVTGLASFRRALRRITWLQVSIAAAMVIAVLLLVVHVRGLRDRSGAEFDTLFAQAGARLAAGDHAQAVELFRKAIAALPDNPRTASAWNDMGWSLYQQGRYEEAMAAFRKALQLQPVFPLARNNLEVAQRQLDLKKSEKERQPASR
ncbi:MAG TPA: tetratricopeptide repeat protein [Candidatus Methylomirabilis sp.]|nr:tetratricopeptide repeat protein [Candidatus Methylomirabilis sp.]